MKKFISLLIAFFIAFSSTTFAKEVFPIVIKGNQRVDEQTIQSYLDLEGVRQNKSSSINNSLKNLFASDLFLEAKIYPRKEKWF